MSDSDPLHVVGELIADKYRIVSCVGEGGFAVVYRAEHAIWNKPVAIKFFNGLSSVPPAQREHFRQAFIQEGALLTELSSQTASIVQARDVGACTMPDGSWMPYMVLEWLDGVSLDALLERERESKLPPWSLEQVIRLLGQAALALDVAHGRGIAHRDVKPANLFILGDDPRSGRATIKLLDFGVAKMVTDDQELQAALARTGSNLTSFTPQYGAPEQFSRNAGPTGPWTDVFALALVAVEMLAGRSALDGHDVVQLAFSSGQPERRPTPRSLGVSVSPAVEAVFAKALSVRPAERYARAREFWKALETAAENSSADSLESPARTEAVPVPPTELAPQLQITGDARPNTATVPSNTSNHISSSSEAEPRRTASPWMLIGISAVVFGSGALIWFGKGSAGVPPPVATVSTTPASSPPPASAEPPKPSCPPRMTQVPAGEFFQGSDAKSALAKEKPAHHVLLDSFCIDLYEVTAGEYKACSDNGKCKRAAETVEWPGITADERRIYSPVCTVGDPERASHPINCVSWEMADLFCKANGKRLPTEAEWEYATRGPDGRIYPWGDDPPTEKHLNACDAECVRWGQKHGADLRPLYDKNDGFATTAPVGMFEAGRSRFGPYDVVGNVWEWVADWDGAYTSAEQKNPTGPDSGNRRVIRGGGWNGSAISWLRPSFRYSMDPGALSHGVGFRCAGTSAVSQ